VTTEVLASPVPSGPARGGAGMARFLRSRRPERRGIDLAQFPGRQDWHDARRTAASGRANLFGSKLFQSR
jgi:hypothetical protein